MAEEPSLSYYLPIAGGRIFWIHTFPKGISAMWNAISLVQDLTRVAVFISYDDNDYTTGTWKEAEGTPQKLLPTSTTLMT